MARKRMSRASLPDRVSRRYAAECAFRYEFCERDNCQNVLHGSAWRFWPDSSRARCRVAVAILGGMQTPTILVVDDEPLIRFSLNERLTADGYRVVEAETAREAIAKSDEGVDLVLLDYKLPDGDGLSVLSRSRSATPTRWSSC